MVIATRNRCASLLSSLGRLAALPEQPRVIVVDNASADGTADIVSDRFPGVHVVRLAQNLGASARTVGVSRADTACVAFSDDDSWWVPGSLARAVSLFGAYPRLGLIAARILVGHRHEEDPLCGEMAASPLKPTMPLPGPPVLGFAACGAVVRRSAFLEVGGFHPRLRLGGEERLLSIDLAHACWGLSYVREVIARHDPSPARDAAERRRTTARNDLWTAWLRLSLRGALRETRFATGQALRDPAARGSLLDAVRGLGWVVGQRNPVAPELNHSLRLLEGREPQKTRR